MFVDNAGADVLLGMIPLARYMPPNLGLLDNTHVLSISLDSVTWRWVTALTEAVCFQAKLFWARSGLLLSL